MVSSESNRAVIESLLTAIRERDDAAFSRAYAEDAVVRQSGVPESLGGVLRGRDAIVENFRRQDPWAVDVKLMFADDTHACVVGKFSGIMTGTQAFKGNGQPFTMYECTVYTVRDDRIEEQLMFANWMDAYVQTGIVDLEALLA
jgi:ketosteroid isomerase-like protein